ARLLVRDGGSAAARHQLRDDVGIDELGAPNTMKPALPRRAGRRVVIALEALVRAYRDERAKSVAILGRVLGDLDLAEDAVQDAFVRAAERWPRAGVPANTGASVVATARNAAIDRIRREQTLARKTELLAR